VDQSRLIILASQQELAPNDIGSLKFEDSQDGADDRNVFTSQIRDFTDVSDNPDRTLRFSLIFTSFALVLYPKPRSIPDLR
jgi:hypothetical protein